MPYLNYISSRVILLAALLPVSLCIQAENIDINLFMLNHDLKIFPLSNIPMEQFFTHQYYVTLGANGLQLSANGENQNAIKIVHDDIQYIGTNNGEWGGKLTVKHAGISQELMSGNIVSLIPIGESLYIIEGLAHLSRSSGSIFKIPNIYDPLAPELVTLLPDAPELVYVDNNRPDLIRIVIVGYQSVMSFDKYRTLSILYWDAFWHFGMRPTSIVRYKNNYFIGLPHGVAVVPAPLGPSSAYCRNESKYLPSNSCTHVRFYADLDFYDEFNK